MPSSRPVFSAITLLGSAILIACAQVDSTRALQVIRRFSAPEATQAVAVDGEFFYAIGSSSIGKYEKEGGRRAAGWEEKSGGRIAHLNSGIVIGNELYCAQSNYPDTPMVSSIEVFDTARMTHLRSVPLPSGLGSATWVVQKDGDWWVTFAHYAGVGGEPGKGPEHTRLVRFDGKWQQRSAWSFPSALVQRWDGMSSSGGTWVDDRLFTTGHHAPEVYTLKLPTTGTELTLLEILQIESEGQGIAIDQATHLLYSIQRSTREVLVSKLP
jgi:hypothetical protein